MDRTIPAEVHPAAMTAADRSVPVILQSSSVASAIAAPMRIGCLRSILATALGRSAWRLIAPVLRPARPRMD